MIRLFALGLAFGLAGVAAAEDFSRLTIPESTPPSDISKAWKVSLVPLLVSQAFDISTSYGLRERNPILSDVNRQFSMQSAAIKLGIVGGVLGFEYLILHRRPNAARMFAHMNWVGATVTTAAAIHNLGIR